MWPQLGERSARWKPADRRGALSACNATHGRRLESALPMSNCLFAFHGAAHDRMAAESARIRCMQRAVARLHSSEHSLASFGSLCLAAGAADGGFWPADWSSARRLMEEKRPLASAHWKADSCLVRRRGRLSLFRPPPPPLPANRFDTRAPPRGRARRVCVAESAGRGHHWPAPMAID